MFFLNLTAGEFFTLFAALSGLVTALYLLDRTKRKKIVSTLRFWTAAHTAEEKQSRRRMREPWSLLLQIAGLLFLLLASAQLQWGTRQRRGRDHVLLLDTSAWASRRMGSGVVLNREIALARRYVSALPASDRVMLVRVDGLATPVTPFTADRAQLLSAIGNSSAGFTALNIDQTLSFARQAQSWSGGRQGEIVYIGPRFIDNDAASPASMANLRVIPVDAGRENVGIRHIGVKRGEEDSNSWQATVTVKNYGADRRVFRLRTQFAGTVFAARNCNLGAGEEMAVEYNFVTDTAGQLLAQIQPGDDLAADDRAALQLPDSRPLRVAVFTRRPEALRPLLAPNRRFSVTFYAPEQYRQNLLTDLIVLDQFAPTSRPRVSALWIAPPRDRSPLPVQNVTADAVVKNWHAEDALGDGLHAKEARIPSAEIFETFPGDEIIASSAEGAIVVARPSSAGQPKLAALGFDPLSGDLKFEVTTPLLFANLLRWLSPESFRTLDFSAGRVGSASVALDPNERTDRIRVTDARGYAVPFAVRARTLELFATTPSIIHVISDDYNRVLSLTLPDIAEFEWKPNTAAQGLPGRASFAPGAADLWQWLALCGAACLTAEWLLYGSGRRPQFGKRPKARRRAPRPAAPFRELVSK